MGTLATLSAGALILLFAYWALERAIIGALARWLIPGADEMSWFKTIVIGIVGSWIGALIGRLTGFSERVPDFVFSIVGAMLLVLLLRTRRPKITPPTTPA